MFKLLLLLSNVWFLSVAAIDLTRLGFYGRITSKRSSEFLSMFAPSLYLYPQHTCLHCEIVAPPHGGG
jgi:hypothetical protein